TNVGGSETKVTRYYYDRVWAEGRINSSSFKNQSGHENPEPRLKALTVTASDAALGAFKPGEDVISRVSAGAKLPVPTAAVEAAKSRFGAAHLTNDAVCICADPGAPRIGDLRVSYRILPAGPLSIIGAQSGSDFAPYQTKAGDKLLMVETGLKPADEMFKGAQRSNTILTWVIRAVAVLVMWIGFSMLFGPFVVLADVIPFLGSLVGIGAGLAAAVATLVVAPVSIAIAWFAYRPIVSAIVLGVGLVLAFLLKRASPKRTPQPVPGTLQPAGMPAAGVASTPPKSFLPPRAKR
ncbi:MAG TPA: TMEM43 family protein, partial [Hyphomicrobiaceae bacterium]|nr:TMEM43 family protein [Hyphomicrobiaceae bacterium]